VARSVCGVYWFHPLVWVCWRHLRLEAERACDDAVVRDGEATAYADQLVTHAVRPSCSSSSWPTTDSRHAA
jgi:beta-lactamase regulating signal transducer with metallopeptidase domain